MTVLPSLVLYWLKDGGADNFKVPPLEDILNLQPYPAYVNLMAGNLERELDGNVSIWVPPEIYEPLGSGRWEGEPSPFPGLASIVKKLQAKGIKVVLSILSHTVEGRKSDLKFSVGWSTMTAEDNESLVRKIKLLKEQINIDGIDIDDEYGPEDKDHNPLGDPKNFYETVRAIRDDPDLKNFVISNPIYDVGSKNVNDELKYQYKPPDEKRHLWDLMTYCATMNYGNDKDSITGLVDFFIRLGIPKDKLYAGVAPGPVDSKGNVCAELYPGEKGPYTPNWTSIKVAEEVAKWAKTNCTGVMIWSYSADTVEYTGCPHRKTGWPNKGDHAWQKAITSVLTAK
jgi:Glycosyl hydrolases family 18